MQLNRTGWFLIGIFMAVVVSCGTDKSSNPPPDDAESFSVEAESFTDMFDVEGSGEIKQTFCSSASNNYVVSGLDRESEWIELAISVPEAGLYDVSIRYSAPQNRTIVLRLTADDCGGEDEPEFTLDEGQWVG